LLAILPLHTRISNAREKMKATVKTLIFLLVSTAMGVSETPQQLGAWSVYPANGNHHSNHIVMLQTTSEAQDGDAGNRAQAKLDVICKNGKLLAIALEPSFSINESAIASDGAVPLTQVVTIAEGQKHEHEYENWAVLDRGRTLSPYSEALQGQLNRSWVERISGMKTVSFQLAATEGTNSPRPTFNTGELAEALSSVGCSY
jgi:hypothetical protein